MNTLGLRAPGGEGLGGTVYLMGPASAEANFGTEAYVDETAVAEAETTVLSASISSILSARVSVEDLSSES